MESFEAVYEELFPQVYRYLLVLCGDRDLAEELTQETFFQAIQHIDSFGEIASSMSGCVKSANGNI